MKRDVEKTLEIPAGKIVSYDGEYITVKFNGKEVKRKTKLNRQITMTQKDSILRVTSKNATKRELKLIGTFISHLKNLIMGLDKDYVYKLEICNVHFPMTVKVDGNTLNIKNFLGEKIERHANLLPNVKTVVKGNIIELSSNDLEAAGQTAANIEIATKIRNRDRRVFQDGIFLVERP